MVTLKEYIESVKEQVQAALGEDAKLSKDIVLELSTTMEVKGGAGINIRVVELGGKVAAQEIQKVTIPFSLKSPTDKIEEAAKKARAEADIKMSEAQKATSKHLIESL